MYCVHCANTHKQTHAHTHTHTAQLLDLLAQTVHSSVTQCNLSKPSQCSLSTHADKQGGGISVTVCLCVCTFTDFPAEDKASGVKFFSAVHRRPKKKKITHFCELCSPEAQNGRIDKRAGHAHPHVNITVEMRRCKRHAKRCAVREIAWRVDVGSACVDYVRVFHVNSLLPVLEFSTSSCSYEELLGVQAFRAPYTIRRVRHRPGITQWLHGSFTL